MNLIAAVDENWGIGFRNKLLYYIPDDLKMFKYITVDAGVVLMGRKTFESIGKPLPDRLNIIISKKDIDYIPDDNANFLCISSIEGALKYLKENNLFDKAYVIGGGIIYNELEKYCFSAFITKVYKSTENVDVYFPDLDEKENWKNTSTSPKHMYNDIVYAFSKYVNNDVQEF